MKVADHSIVGTCWHNWLLNNHYRCSKDLSCCIYLNLYMKLEQDLLGFHEGNDMQQRFALDLDLSGIQENPLKESPRKNGDVKAPPPNIHSFLSKVGIMEIRYIRMLASLCSLTYSMTRMSVSLPIIAPLLLSKINALKI